MSGLCVRDLMTCGVFAVLPDDDLDSLHRLMDGWRVRHAPVVDEQNVLIGLVSERDLLRNTLLGHPGAPADAVAAELRTLPVAGLMQVWPLVAYPDESIDAAAGRMLDAGVDCLPVVDAETRLVGIITEADFVRWFAQHDALGPAS
jgi:CBS domain-containing protein